MKLLSAIVIFSALIAPGCMKKKTENSTAKSNEGGLTDEEYYVKAEVYLRFLPCFSTNEFKREGDKVTIHTEGDDQMAVPLDKCIEPLKMFPTMFDVIQADKNDVILRILKTTTVEVFTEYFKRFGPDTCVKSSRVTDKGIEFTLSENGSEVCKTSLDQLSLYFGIVEKTDTKLVLGRVTKGYACVTQDKSVTVTHFKDFGVQTVGELFEPVSYATYLKEGGEEVRLNHCDFEFNMPGANAEAGNTMASLVCSSDDKKIQSKFEVSAISIKSSIIEDGQERPTSCKMPDAH
ncbi:MAG: hypothetical protein AB7T49_04985 [Oligoflexales bacterium]